MYVVIFRARVRSFDADYFATAARMRELALNHFGCTEFFSLTEGAEEVALSYWPTEERIKAWRSAPEHLEAQRLGRERWYETYSVQVAQVTREYRADSPSTHKRVSAETFPDGT